MPAENIFRCWLLVSNVGDSRQVSFDKGDRIISLLLENRINLMQVFHPSGIDPQQFSFDKGDSVVLQY